MASSDAYRGRGRSSGLPLERRALPGTMIDLICDGVCEADLRRRGGRAAYSAVFRTAMSAIQHGWHLHDWVTEMTLPRSQLGRQFATRTNGTAVDPKKLDANLARVWSSAAEKVAANPPVTAEEIPGLLVEIREESVRDDQLNAKERLVLEVVLELASEHNTLRVAAPWRTVKERSGLSEYVCKKALASPSLLGRYFDLAEKGKRGTFKGRANLYRLRLPSRPSPVNRACGTHQQGGTYVGDSLGSRSLRQVRGTDLWESRSLPADQEVDLVVRVKAHRAPLVAETLRELIPLIEGIVPTITTRLVQRDVVPPNSQITQAGCTGDGRPRWGDGMSQPQGFEDQR